MSTCGRRRAKPQRVRAVVRIESTDADTYVLARLRGRTADDVLRLARHLGYQRCAESVEVWTWRMRKRHVGGRVRRVKTCERWTYERESQTRPPSKKLTLMERTRVSRREVPKMTMKRRTM